METKQAYCGHCGGKVHYFWSGMVAMFYHNEGEELKPGCAGKLFRHQKIVDGTGTDWWASNLADTTAR